MARQFKTIKQQFEELLTTSLTLATGDSEEAIARAASIVQDISQHVAKAGKHVKMQLSAFLRKKRQYIDAMIFLATENPRLRKEPLRLLLEELRVYFPRGTPIPVME